MGKWTYENIPFQEDRIAIVTGANSGIGYFTAKGLAEKGCEVIMACRRLDMAEEARRKLLKIIPDGKLVVKKLDLASLKSVREFALDFNHTYSKLDLLINNAGLMAIPYRRTEDGFEMQFGVNHLGHFALTSLVFDKLKNTANSRIVSVSSSAHKMGEIQFDDIHWEKRYNKWRAYGMSKLANIYFFQELAHKISDRNLSILALASHPGYADSKLLEKGPAMKGRKLLVKAGRFANRLVAQSSEMGALPSLYAACSPDVEQSGYYGPGGFSGMKGYPVRVFPHKKKLSKHIQEKLWSLSEELTRVHFLSE